MFYDRTMTNKHSKSPPQVNHLTVVKENKLEK